MNSSKETSEKYIPRDNYKKSLLTTININDMIDDDKPNMSYNSVLNSAVWVFPPISSSFFTLAGVLQLNSILTQSTWR